MTSMLTRPDDTSTSASVRLRGSGQRRPLVLVAVLGGLAAALAPLLVCLALGVVGWFVSDAGAHGAPRDGLRAGAVGWLLAHGSGVRVAGAAVSVVPLGLTVLCGWVSWRFGLRVGDSVSGHGPDAAGLADGERDWTVPVATTLFAGTYAAAAVSTGYLAGALGPGSGGSVIRVLAWCAVLAVCAVLPGVAVGSGRAAIWAAALPAAVRASLGTAARILLAQLAVSAVLLAVALGRGFATGATVLSQLRFDTGEAALLTLVTATITPNAVIFAGSYLLGPGFAVGTGTLVSPTLVSVGPVPAVPLLAALPDNGPGPSWAVALLALPALVALVAPVSVRTPAGPERRWERGALHGCVGGVLAGVGFAVLAAVAGGSAGPGRMRLVAPYAVDVLVHSVTAFGLGGLLGGLLLTWRLRRAAARESG